MDLEEEKRQNEEIMAQMKFVEELLARMKKIENQVIHTTHTSVLGGVCCLCAWCVRRVVRCVVCGGCIGRWMDWHVVRGGWIGM